MRRPGVSVRFAVIGADSGKAGGFPWGYYGTEDTSNQVRLFTWCPAWMRTEELNFRMNSLEQRATQDQLLKGWFSVPWAAKIWAENKATYDTDFAVHTDKFLEEVSRSGVASAEIFSSRK